MSTTDQSGIEPGKGTEFADVKVGSDANQSYVLTLYISGLSPARALPWSQSREFVIRN